MDISVKSIRIIVIGGGASGLAFALSCARNGVTVRIVDRRPSRSPILKATGVALGVWRQLAPYGITASLLGDAVPMRNFVFHDEGHLIASVPVPLVDGEPPAHLFPQNRLETAIEEALLSHGVAVEYGTTFESIQQTGDTVRVVLRGKNGAPDVLDADWLIGADGAHSEVRALTGMPFAGRDYPEQWSVAEVLTEQWPRDIQAQLFLRSDGVGLFLSQPEPKIVQGILNGVGAASAMQEKFPDSIVKYERLFRVSLRRVRTPRSGRVWLIGDAAHAQSPVGGQGLNLAIWDGITLGNALAEGDVSVEHRLAGRAKRVLLFTDFDYRMLATKSIILRNLRNIYWWIASKYPRCARWFFWIISGVT